MKQKVNEIITADIFKNRFVGLINLYVNIVSNIDINSNDNIYKLDLIGTKNLYKIF